MQKKMTAARINAAPSMDPITMPAMAPPESPEPDAPEPFAAPPVALADDDDVLVGNTGGIEIVVGSVIPWQRDSTLAVMQQESVELTVLSAQNEHNPCKFPW